MSNCQFLVHPVNNQSILVNVNELVPMYYGLNDVLFGTSGNISTILKPFSNLYVLESNQTGFVNIEPLRPVTVLGKGLPNGMGFYKYNAITGRSAVTGNWEVHAFYRYNTGDPNVPYNSPVKTFNINVRPSGTFIDNSFFEVITGSNGEQLLPISGNNGQILVPITGENGQPGYIESGFLQSGTGCKQTLNSGGLLPFNFCVTGECPSGQTCQYIDSSGETQEGGVQEPSQGGQKGDPINTLPLRIITSGMISFNNSNPTVINSMDNGCNFYTTRYIDTRERTECFFLGRIGSTYVRLDTLSWSDPKNPSTLGVLRGINITKGIIHSINSNREITNYTETEGTMYFVGNNTLSGVGASGEFSAEDFTWGNLWQKNKGGQPIPIIRNPNGFLQGFFVSKNIGINDVTALSFSWCYGNFCGVDASTLCDLISARLATRFMGGQVNFTLGELFRFDEIGGSLIENMQYNYNTASLNQSGNNENVIDISASAPWRDWGATLKFTNINDKFRHFYGLDWSYTKGTAPSNINWRKFLTTGNLSFTYSLSNNYTSANNCVMSVSCPSCDPGCPCFTGHQITLPDTVEMCAANGVMAPRWLCACYTNSNVSTTSSLTPEMLLELIN